MAPLGGLPVRWYPANWNLAQRKERERFQPVVKDIPETLTTSTLYPEDRTQSPISYLGCKYFKIVQERKTRKLITYYESWADLDKVTGKDINIQEFTGVWQRYFSPQLSRGRNRPPRSASYQKKNQAAGHKPPTNKTEYTNKSSSTFGKKKSNKALHLEKVDSGTDRVAILAEIRAILR